MKTVNPYCKDVNTIEYVLNYKKSRGSYFADIDNNVILDLEMQDGTLPLGYNDKSMIRLLKRNKLDPYQLNGGSVYMFPTQEVNKAITSEILKVAPGEGFKVLFTEGPANSAVELAVKMALLKKEGKIAILGEAQHGSSYGSLFSVNEGNGLGVDVKTVRLPFPELLYPLTLNEPGNRLKEDDCLNGIKKSLDESIAAIIVSPIQVLVIGNSSILVIMQHLLFSIVPLER
jgi:4-aminobutyrate aminotransferase-like enzyme